MDNDTQALAGCASILALLILAPFVIVAIPVLLGLVLGIVAFWMVVLFISAIVRGIFG